MRLFIIMLIIILGASFTMACGPAPMGETNYKEIKEEIQKGETPPPEVEREEKEYKVGEF